MRRKNIFLTGDIHVGKSTAIACFLKKYISSSSIIAGFKTKTLYENDYLKGYYIQSQIPPIISNIHENLVGVNSDFGKGKSCYGILEVFEKKALKY